MTARRPDAEFWRGKRVFVTGHTGFKGGWLCLVLERLGAEWAGLSLPPETKPSLFKLARIQKGGSNSFADIRDSRAVKSALTVFKPEIVLHLAAQALVRRSYLNPVENFTTNVTGTIQLLEEACLCDSVKAAVVVTTDKVYRNNENGAAFSEEDSLGGHDPYSSSKAAAEMVVQSYRKSFFSPLRKGLASARAGNVIGGGDWAEDRIFPDAVRAWQDGESLEVRNPESTRPWQHVLEPLNGYLCLAEAIHKNPAASTDFNFGPDPGDVATVREVVEIARAVYGRGDVHWGIKRDTLHEAGTLALDNSKAKAQLGVRPVWELQEAVERTMSWYRRQADGENARTLCEQDIEAFLEAK
jgi:CDP-glucose 4,6-dehydratase